MNDSRFEFLHSSFQEFHSPLDLNKFPHWIDILITLNDDNTVYDVMLGILEFSDDYKEMKICLDFGEGEGRPTSFIPDDTLIMFRRE